MSIGPRLDLRQSQQLLMTPQLQQAIKLLALTNIELEAHLTAEIEKNPLLDFAPPEASAVEDERGDREPPTAEVADGGPDGDAPEPPTADQLIAAGNGDHDAPLDVDYGAETFHHDTPADRNDAGGGLTSGSGGDAGDGGGEIDAMAASAASLGDLLCEQAAAAFRGADLLIARYLIDLIDDAGYLSGSVEEVAERLDADPLRVEQVLGIIQRFEPAGVGARSLSECLAIQAREADRYDPAMATLIAHLDLVARGDLAALRRLCGVDQEDLVDMIRELRGYQPKPGLRYGGDRAPPINADVFVHRLRSGGWSVELNAATLPRVLVDRAYYVELSSAAPGKATRSFLAECLASANWLTKALDQRARTIVKVASELVRQQEAFFTHGVHALRPLTLRAIADKINMHESTVSRVTSNKYLQCDRGLFELKYFFTTSIASSDGGEAASSAAVRAAIGRLIAAEPPHATLSDDTLVELLRADGFDIARRTVAKYREAMGLGSSVARRRARLLAAAG